MHSNLEAEVKLIPQHTLNLGVLWLLLYSRWFLDLPNIKLVPIITKFVSLILILMSINKTDWYDLTEKPLP
jgi:hypothetical protein